MQRQARKLLEETPWSSVRLTIPGIPPSGNHYKSAIRRKLVNGHGVLGFQLTPEAQTFRDLVWLQANGRTIAPATDRERDKVRYALTVTVYLGAGQRGDGDNFWKCIADSLQHAGVIHSDARVRRWVLEVEDCDREHPRTEILAERIERRTE